MHYTPAFILIGALAMADWIVPRDYQHHAVHSVYHYFNEHSGNPLVVMPTGTGKSVCIALLIYRMLHEYEGQRTIAVTHVKELIEQNVDKVRRLWPNAPVGICSASLRERSTRNSIVFGGIGSCYNDPAAFGHRDTLLIDEAHLVGPNETAMYTRFIDGLRKTNPFLKIIGFTATDYRMKMGRLTNGGMFTDVAVDMATTEWIAWFIANNYMVPLITRPTQTQIDTSNVGVQNGEYNQTQLQKAADRSDVTQSAVDEAISLAHDRRKWLFFCSGVEHAHHVAEMLTLRGIPALAVHSNTKDYKMSNEERDRRIMAFKRGEIRAITNNNILTTGFDDPEIDMIGDMRPTTSPGLRIQMLGRGTRPAPYKKNCLVLDYSGNTVRHGPFDNPRIPGPPGSGTGDMPVKTCDNCGFFNHISARVCVVCGDPFEIANKLSFQASAQQIMSGAAPQVDWFSVQRVYYNTHQSTILNAAGGTKPETLCVRYACGANQFREFIAFESEHPGARHRASQWWMQRTSKFVPATSLEAMRDAEAGWLRVPRRVRVHVNKKYPEILGYEF